MIGTQHGDEGKGRFVDGLARQYDWVARYQGGPNAGHTVKVSGMTIALNAIPSGVVYPDKKLYIAAHCVVDPIALCTEIARIEKAGLSVRNRLRISPQASIIQPSHVLRDCATIQGKVGTTGKGIGPTYAAQDMRVEDDRQLDLRMGDLITHPHRTLFMIEKNLEAEMEKLDISGEEYDVAGTIVNLKRCVDQITDMIDHDPLLLLKAVRNKAKILMEGAQAFGLDRTFGVTPNVTSSNTGVAAAFVSTGIPVDYKRNAWGVAKLIPSRVGHGPFVPEFGGKRSEDHCMREGGNYHTRQKEAEIYGEYVDTLLASNDPLEVGIALRIKGGEYGATTGRPRRIGIFDTAQLEYAIGPNGLDGIYLTMADCLRAYSNTALGMIPVATGYRIGTQEIDYIPTTNEELYTVQPVVEYYPAFSQDITHVRNVKDLPHELLTLLDYIRERLGTELIAMGVGPDREQVVPLGEHL